MTITFLFWNIHRKPLQQTIANLVLRHNVDVLMLVECAIFPGTMLRIINQQADLPFSLARDYDLCEKVVVYTRFPKEFLIPREDDINRLTIRHLKMPSQPEILLAVVHFISKTAYNEYDQLTETIKLADHIRKVEEPVGHRRTLLVGDFNMNPFDIGIINAKGLHAVMTKEIAAKEERIIQGLAYPFFYNPMWNFFGDARGNIPGTYYYSHSGYLSFFWNIFDQVLLRPDLIPYFNHNDLKIISNDGKISFLKNGKPDPSIASDHLPILFKLNL